MVPRHRGADNPLAHLGSLVGSHTTHAVVNHRGDDGHMVLVVNTDDVAQGGRGHKACTGMNTRHSKMGAPTCTQPSPHTHMHTAHMHTGPTTHAKGTPL